jgi:hypothetical protein
MPYSVEVRSDATKIGSLMERMREWLDAQRIEPDVFRHAVDEAGVLIHLQFKVESEASAFGDAFSGRLL